MKLKRLIYNLTIQTTATVTLLYITVRCKKFTKAHRSSRFGAKRTLEQSKCSRACTIVQSKEMVTLTTSVQSTLEYKPALVRIVSIMLI